MDSIYVHLIIHIGVNSTKMTENTISLNDQLKYLISRVDLPAISDLVMHTAAHVDVTRKRLVELYMKYNETNFIDLLYNNVLRFLRGEISPRMIGDVGIEVPNYIVNKDATHNICYLCIGKFIILCDPNVKSPVDDEKAYPVINGEVMLEDYEAAKMSPKDGIIVFYKPFQILYELDQFIYTNYMFANILLKATPAEIIALSNNEFIAKGATNITPQVLLSMFKWDNLERYCKI